MPLNKVTGTRKLDLYLIRTKNDTSNRFCCYSGPQSEIEKLDKYLELAGELKKVLNLKVTLIAIDVDTIQTITKGLKERLEELETNGKIDNIKTTTLSI